MVPYKNGKANRGHSCVKGPLRLRLRKPQGPDPQADDPRHDHEPWREVSWDEALRLPSDRLRAIQAKHGPEAVGVITPRRAARTRKPSLSKAERVRCS